MCAEFPTFIKGVMVVLVKSLQGFFCKRQRKTCRACHNYPVWPTKMIMHVKKICVIVENG